MTTEIAIIKDGKVFRVEAPLPQRYSPGIGR